ncbi:MAG: nicotinate-nucleotide--dimethylbenzimidazole phosphoribosyltransferase [Phascolarctobacterium sp.]|uniref:nicotinate-nucleotide--dimethylbenzimidazole phosphoribosyltransferase n=1 Tax=Phascolarctobacterium sp. TaxID=2049039 RepID=UPI0025EF0217|nr:nicotinate-nucleotide--dimethylbenzimidazole phosphoribosyltransferase [Phascolarctobacterium sp.]MCC8158978.1 nicotinate-nucleotide--dimethylbenzimidazole phosphoribosyltransferase [Phascolarctobacterium sp.]
MDINNIIEQIKPIDSQKVDEAQSRFDNLIKPVGSLAKLEEMVSRYAGIIGSADKKAVQYPKKALLLWSADTQAVAKAMQGELPVVLLAHEAKAEVYPLMTTAVNLEDALEEGAILTKEYITTEKLQMVALGSPEQYQLTEQMEALLELKGIEFLQKLDDHVITAMTGAVLQAAACKVPVMLDGIAACLAAIAAGKLAPVSLEYCLAGHVSAEPGMEKLLNWLQMSAPLRLAINSGAGEGAVLAFTLFDAGIKAYNEMETFAEAGVHAEMEEFSHSVQVKGK